MTLMNTVRIQSRFEVNSGFQFGQVTKNLACIDIKHS